MGRRLNSLKWWRPLAAAAGFALVVAGVAALAATEKGTSTASSTASALAPRSPGRSAWTQPTSAQPGPVSANGLGTITVGHSYKNDVSPPLRSIRPVPITIHHEPAEQENENLKLGGHRDAPDPVVQSAPAKPNMPSPILNFDGIPFPGVDCNCVPPDTNGEVGRSQYVQDVNNGFQVFNKFTGASVYGPVGIATLWGRFGGNCSFEAHGDPVVFYDQLANRWVITQFAGSPLPTDECIAVSRSSDATGKYNRYAFVLGTHFFDYPKFGLWPDAYYMSVNVFSEAGTNPYLGPQPFAFDRAAMLAGNPATFITTSGPTATESKNSYIPADLDGSTVPPGGAPEPFVAWPAQATPVYRIYRFHVDWTTPTNSAFTLVSTSPPAAPFSTLCFTLPVVDPPANCVPQLGTTSGLDGLADRFMFRAAYRNFGDHESLVANYTVKSNGVAAPRWVELRSLTSGTPSVFQESTYQPDTTWRWMGSAAMDKNGDLALGFSASDATINPQLRYAGRLASDPPNTLGQGEAHLFDGAGSQVGSLNRWGDYSDMTVDPQDDCTFWYTNEYYATTTGFAWKTRIGNFKFPSCSSGTFRVLTVTKSGNREGEITSSPDGVICGGACAAQFSDGTSVTLTATPAAGSNFTGWSGDCTGTGTCTLTMNANHSATATFASDNGLETLIVNKTGDGDGTVSSIPAGIDCGSTCVHDFAAGTSVTLTATASAGSTFTGWSDDCSGTGTCTLTMDANHSATAEFASDNVPPPPTLSRTLTVSKGGLGTGTVTSSPAGIDCGSACSHDFDYATSVTLTATPAAGSTFTGWSGDCSGTGACTLMMDDDRQVTASFFRSEGPGAILDLSGCTANTFDRNDDGSTPLVPVGFTASFFDVGFSQVYINNNGNLTFTNPKPTYTPYDFTLQTDPIIAPFFADVDTRALDDGSLPVTFGPTTFDGHHAFCIDWVNVGYFGQHTDKLNSFQLLLIDRSDTGPGNFDIMFNFDKVLWETGDASGGGNGFGGTPARMGFTNGDGDPSHSYVQPGSGDTLALLDSNEATGLIHHSFGTAQLGRYIFPVRNVPPTGSTLEGLVKDPNGNPVPGAPVEVCTGPNQCPYARFADSAGMYRVKNLPQGNYTVIGHPPTSSNLTNGEGGPVAVSGDVPPFGVFNQDVMLGPAPGAPPPGTTITNVGDTDGVPVVYWDDPLTLETLGCANGTAEYKILVGGVVVRQGPMTEDPAGSGHYIASNIHPLYPNHGDGQIQITIHCGGSDTETDFGIYIDPSGVVTDIATGQPIAGATVTLLRAPSATDAFTPVPDGSAVMSPANRVNPGTTGEDGSFGWDVIAGFYKVRAAKDGCLPAETDVLKIPPPVTDLNIRLDCGNALPALTVTRAGTGSGTVSSIPAGIDCGSTCSAGYAFGTEVTLTATPAAGSNFTGWSGDCTGTGTCTLTMSANHAAAATFAADKTLTVAKAGSGTGTVSSSPAGISCGSTCSHAYAHGTSITLTAAASSRSKFAGWSGDCSGTGSCTLTMDANHSATVTFNALCIVPKVKGKKLAAAKQAIAKAKCQTGKIKGAYSAKKKGTVIAQKPGPGTKLAKDGKVNLVVSKGKR